MRSLPFYFSCSWRQSYSARHGNGGSLFVEGNESFYTKTSLCRSLLRNSHSSRFNTGPRDDDLTIACVGGRTAQALLRHWPESIHRDLVMRLRSQLREDR